MAERFIIFGRSSCPSCMHAVDFCTAGAIPYTFLDYASAPSILEEYKEFYTQETVPIILSSNLHTGATKKIGGYSDLLAYLS